jgi:4-amino-4-deoxy-L-arabinose transferase-like glycosyltransferase
VSSSWPPPISRRTENILVASIVMIALVLRIAAPWFAPRGWRDDELSSALVVTGHVLDGDIRVYYPDASGHEGLYEYFQAVTMLLFGPGVWGIRGPSILFGTLAVLLTYILTRRLFDWPTAAIAALALAISFWSLMYSRTGQRHISVTVTTLLSFIFLWIAVQHSSKDHADRKKMWTAFTLSGVFMGLGFYTYFASRGLPLIVIAWAAYLLIWQRDLFSHVWRGFVLVLVVAVLISIPLVITLRAQPEAETRVNEVAVPLRDASEGNYTTLARYAVTTLSMFTHEGDEEWMYNVPHRPVFGTVGAGLFWAGVILALIWTFGPRHSAQSVFLLLWLGAGIAPGMLSVPAASLGHTILAQPVAMIFPALAISAAGHWLIERPNLSRSASRGALAGLILVFLGWEAFRGIYDYWIIWPADPYNRVLHYTDFHEASVWLNQQTGTRDIALGGLLVERWDQQAAQIDLRGDDWRLRMFNPESAYIEFPGEGLAVIPQYQVGTWGAQHLGEPLPIEAVYEIRPINAPEIVALDASVLARFDNGLALLGYVATVEDRMLIVIGQWHVEQALDLPLFPLYSKPPAPGEDDRPRLAIFLQLLDDNGQRITGADGLGVDPYTLYPGDVFYQRMIIPLTDVPPSLYRLVIGLYNPATGERLLDTMSGDDAILLEQWQRD